MFVEVLLWTQLECRKDPLDVKRGFVEHEKLVVVRWVETCTKEFLLHGDRTTFSVDSLLFMTVVKDYFIVRNTGYYQKLGTVTGDIEVKDFQGEET